MNYIFYIENCELCWKELNNMIHLNTLKANEDAIITNESKLCFINSQLNREYRKQFKTTTNPNDADYIVINAKIKKKPEIKKFYQCYNVLTELCNARTYESIVAQYNNVPNYETNIFYFDKSCLLAYDEAWNISNKCNDALNDFALNYLCETNHNYDIALCTEEPIDINKIVYENQIADANTNIITDDKYDNLNKMLERRDTMNIALKIIDSCNIKKSIFNVLKLLYNNHWAVKECSTSLIRNLIRTLDMNQANLARLYPVQCMRILSNYNALTKTAFEYFNEKGIQTYSCSNGNSIRLRYEALFYDPEPEPIIKEEVKPKINRDLFGEPMTITAKQTTKIKSKELNW